MPETLPRRPRRIAIATVWPNSLSKLRGLCAFYRWQLSLVALITLSVGVFTEQAKQLPAIE